MISDNAYKYQLDKLKRESKETKEKAFREVNNEKFLFDPSINIRIAWKLFKDSNYKFTLWACEGR